MVDSELKLEAGPSGKESPDREKRFDEMPADVTLTIECRPAGKRHVVTVSNGEPIHIDKIDLLSAKSRANFVTALGKKYKAIPAKDVHKILEAEAARIGENKPADKHISEGEELSASMVLRPELFLTFDACGIAVPCTRLLAGGPKAQLYIYLQWKDGRRETKTLESSIQVGEQRIFFSPIPDEPSAGTDPGWSAAARKRWLDGEVVDPLKVFTGLCEAVAHYLDLPYPESTTAIIVLWVMLTYLYPAWDAVPYLYAGGPKGSGKTRLFEVLQRLVFRAFCSSNISAPCLFRTLHNNGGTLILDEAERLKESTPDALEIRSILLAGYKRGGKASRLEAFGDSFKMVEFQVFGPKAIGCIAGLPGSLMDRCISIIMFRAPAGSEKPKRRIDENPERWQTLRDDLHAMALQFGSSIAVMAADSTVCPTEISGRNYELWQPLMRLAAWIEFHGARGLLEIVRDHALRNIAEQEDDGVGEVEEIVLKALAILVQSGSRPTAKDVLVQAREEEPELFRRFTAKGTSTVLRRFGLRTTRTHGISRYETDRAALIRVQARYGIDLGLPVETNTNSPTPTDVHPQAPTCAPTGCKNGEHDYE